jgi:hypothetical protein
MNLDAHSRTRALLPDYLSGSLDATTQARIGAHVATCAACQQELETWRLIADTWRTSSQAVVAPPAVFEAAVLQIAQRERRLSRVQGLLQALRAAHLLLVEQARLMRQGFWLASALGIIVSWLIALSSPASSVQIVLSLTIPLLTAVGVSLIFYPTLDPFIEIVLATPTSLRLLLLARLTVVLAYDGALALAATASLAAFAHGGSVWLFVSGWLGPMVFLAALALLISQRWGTTAGMAAALSAWAARVLLAANDQLGVLNPFLAARLSAYWSTNVVSLAVALSLFAIVLCAPFPSRLIQGRSL